MVSGKNAIIPSGATIEAAQDAPKEGPKVFAPGSGTFAQAPVENPKSVALPDLKDNLVREMKHFLNTRGSEMQSQVQLKLEPEHLGQITIKLMFNGKGELSAHFWAENNYVKGVLEGSLPQLREALNQQELRLNEAFVSVGDGNRGEESRQFENGNRQGMTFSGKYGGGTGLNRGDPAEIASSDMDLSQVNYLV